MPEPTKRTPSLSDLMILVAFLAGSLVLYRALMPAFQNQWNAPVPLKPTLRFYYMSTVAFPLMAALTMAVPILQLRPPRSRRVFRQPGTVACIAASLALVFLAIWASLVWITPTRSASLHWPIQMCYEVRDRVGFIVAGTWYGLGMRGCSYRKSDWVDRLGIILGISWLIGPVWKVIAQIPWF